MGKRKKRKLSRQLRKLINEQYWDMKYSDYIDNKFDSSSTDIYHRRKRATGSGFRTK